MTWDIQDKTVLITGATDGIGKAVALALAKRGARLVLVSRDRERGERVLQELKKRSKNYNIEMLACDLAKLSSVADCAKEFAQRFDALHVLIHVAGVLSACREENEGIERTMAVNYFAPVLLTELLLPLMKQSAPARIIMVTSSMHKYGIINLDMLDGRGSYDGMQAYSNSKLALMLYALYLSRALSRDVITVTTVHPGWIRTKLAKGLNENLSIKQRLTQLLRMRSPSWGARSIVHLASSPEAAAMHGAYVIKELPVEPKPAARDYALAEVLAARTRLLLASYLGQ
jgi:NAD(P)-dependent dehydrogenase (short-subunit alcohol dehydrogenase family)